MNEVKLSPISNREDYSESFQAMDENGDAIDLEAAGATIVCEMREPECGTLTALTVEIEDDTFTISLTEAQTRSLSLVEYDIGCTIEMDDFKVQFFVGILPVVDGVVS
jgi:hypothetical protein